MVKRMVAIFAIAGLTALLLGAVACGDDDDDGGGGAEEKQELADLAVRVASVNGNDASQEDIDFYAGSITDAFVQEFGTESVEACIEDAGNCIGDPLPNPVVDTESVEIDGDSATLILESDEGDFGMELIKDNDVWKANGLFVPDDELSEGVEVVNVDMNEFAFGANLETDVVKSGDFAIHANNAGQQTHEVVLIALPDEGSIEDLIQDDAFQPEPILVKFPYGPGEASDIALPAPLEPGRYGLLCFLPDTDDPEFTPHAFKGMTREFTVE